MTSVHGVLAGGIALMPLALLAAGTAMGIAMDIKTMRPTIVLILVTFSAGGPTWVVASGELLLLLERLLLLLIGLRGIRWWWH